jgi:hypothetical protein
MEDAAPPPVEAILARAFAPIHKRVFGTAVGFTAAAVVWLLTMFHVLAGPRAGLPIELLAQVFYGFTVTWRGALVGAWWAFVVGFVAGWFAAFLRNLCIAVWLTSVRIRADLRQTGDFLDQI